MKKTIDLFYDVFTQKGWTIRRRYREICDFPECIKKRYSNIPIEYIDFLCHIDTCINSDETIWFLGIDDFQKQDEDAFRWNEFEMISLQSAIDDNDIKWQNEIKCFWDNHLPICISIDGEYEYYAIRMNDGVVVHGIEPEFEETTEIAISFKRFIEMLCL